MGRRDEGLGANPASVRLLPGVAAFMHSLVFGEHGYLGKRFVTQAARVRSRLGRVGHVG